MQAQIGSVGTSITRALDATPKEHYCSLANTPWKWLSDPVYWVKHLGSLFGPVVLSSCQLKESEFKLVSLTPPWPSLCPLQTQLLCPATFFPKYFLDSLRNMCLLSPALSLTHLDSFQDLRPTLASPFHSYPIHLLLCSQGDLVTLYPPHITHNGCPLLQDKHQNPCSGWQGPSGSSCFLHHSLWAVPCLLLPRDFYQAVPSSLNAFPSPYFVVFLPHYSFRL